MIARLKNALRHIFGLGLTKVPSNPNATISDLFFWSTIGGLNITYEYLGFIDFF